MGVYLHQQNSKTMKSPIKIRQEWRALNLEINSQLKMAGKPLSQLPDSEWKQWIIELMNYRDTLTPLVK